jgi:hypothetical protein
MQRMFGKNVSNSGKPDQPGRALTQLEDDLVKGTA